MSLKQAIKEAYASAPVDEVIVSTLELIHPSFVDDQGNPTAARVANSYQDYTFGLEATAPRNAGEMVLFQRCAFSLTLPQWSEGAAPELQLKIDNVSREITRYLEQAIVQLTPILVIYRPYLASDPTLPQMDPPFIFSLSKVQVDTFQITGTANTNDVHNWPFPNEKYDPARFPGLVR